MLLIFLLVTQFLVSCASMEREETVSDDGKPDLLIRNLYDLFPDYKTHLKGVTTDKVYVIVHPSYYLFFHKKPFHVAADNSKNVVETFVTSEYTGKSAVITLMKEYERSEMKFIGSANQEKRLVILVLPGGYLESKNYLYKNGPDEYTRYLNEFSGGSDSILYIETRSTFTGKIGKSGRTLLLDFLKKIGAKEIYIGGGYVGRCQEEFYKLAAKIWPEDQIALIPELSAFSPNDITDSTAKMLLTADNRMNTWAMKYFIKNGGVKTLKGDVNIKNLSSAELIR